MRNDKAGKAMIEDAMIIAEEARISFEPGHYHRVIRKCQEAAELAVKGLFKYVGIEYPKSHILGRVIKKELSKRNILNREELEKLAYISDMLSFDRQPSFYGAPDGTPASKLYDAEDATDALEKTSWLIAKVKSLFRGVLS